MACPPGMRGCAATCGHRMFVEGYRQERKRMEIAGENASLGYAEELRDWLEANPIPTFKDWLIQSKREPMPEPINYPEPSQFMRFTTEAEANEASLLAIAMNTEDGVEMLRVLDVDQEFTNPFHTQIAHAITDLADSGQAHDAEVTTDLLRGRGQLPPQWDPARPMRSAEAPLQVHQASPLDLDVPLRTVDPTRYGLGAWQAHAMPGYSAGSFASDIRADYLPRHLVDITERATALADAAVASGDVAAVKTARLAMAQELVDFPPELGYDGKPKMATSAAAVPLDEKWNKHGEAPVWTPTPVGSERVVRDLRLPKPPALSPIGRQVLTLRGA